MASVPPDVSGAPFVWFGAVADASGHADELRGFLRAQERAGHRPAARPLPWGASEVKLSRADRAMLDRQSKRHVALPVVAVHHYLPKREQPHLEGAVNVARAMFETDRLPASWLSPLLARDEVWVPCTHNFEVFERSGIPAEKLRVVGETLDFDLFTPGAEPYPLDVEEGRFVFLTNFDFSARKAWEVLLRAWGRAFDADDGPCLVLKTGSFYKEIDYVRERIETFLEDEFGARRARLAPIHLLTDVLPAADMPRLYAAADAYALASRGEGWGRPYMEAMAMGLPTIASAWSGNLEFMDPDTSWLVEGELVDVPEDAELFNSLYKGHRWFEPDADALAAALRAVATDPQASRRAAEARERLIERFGPEAMAATLAKAGHAAMARFTDERRPTCVVRGTFGSTASLSTVNDRLAAGLEEAGMTVRHRAPGDAGPGDRSVGIAHHWPPSFVPVTAGPTVVVLPWEYGAPPADWVVGARSHADRVWVPSAFVREGFVAGGMPPGVVEVVPNGVDLERYNPDGPAREIAGRRGCTFLFVGGTIWRKGIDLLAAAWREAFGPDDDVTLVVKDFGTRTWYRGQTGGDALRALADSGEAAPIVYLDEELDAAELPALYRACDALVAPYRGEGFCMPALEAMACGLPVVHTGAGPTGEFVPADGGWALPSRRIPVPERFDLEGLAGQATVHEVDHEALVAALRAVAADPAERARRGAAAHSAAQAYGWTAIARRAVALLDELREEDLPLARDIAPAEVDGHDHVVLYSPDWADEQRWGQTLERWARTFAADDPITLALHCGDADAGTVGAEIMARLQSAGLDLDAVPDLALLRPGSAGVHSLVAAARAVLVDDPELAPATLVRRAARMLTSDELALRAYRAQALETTAAEALAS